MEKIESLPKPMNSKNVKLLYDTIKQDIFNINIKVKLNNIIKRNHISNSKLFNNNEKYNLPKKLKRQKNYLNLTMLGGYKKYLERIIHNKFIKLYQMTEDIYNIKIINEIISNENTHIVALFKDYLIKDDINEFIYNFYKLNESILILKEIFKYYKYNSVVYPNYILLPEKKYIYKNIKKKQKIIDLREQNINNRYEKCKKKLLIENTFYENKKVFDSNVVDSILNISNSSNINNIIFGISNDTDNFDIEYKNIYNLIEKINKVEEENKYNKYIEKSQVNNNNKNINNSNFNLNKKNIIINNLIVKNIQNVKQIIINESNKNYKTDNKNYNDQSNIKKMNINNTSDIKLDKSNLDLKSVNKKGNLYSLYLYKNKGDKKDKINAIKNLIVNYYNNQKEKSNNSLNSILKTKKINKKSRNYQSNFIESNDNIKLNTLNYFIKKDLNKCKNNQIIKGKLNIKNKDLNLKGSKEKIIDNKNKVINNIDKKIFPKIFNQNLSKIEIDNNNYNNNSQIKKSIIDGLLSSISSAKETWRNSKFTESLRDFSYKSMNFTERGKIPNKNLNKQKELENLKNTNDIFESISKILCSNKTKNSNSLGKDIIRNNTGNINNCNSSLGKNFKKQNKNKNTLNIDIKNDISNIKNSIKVHNNTDHCRCFSKEFYNDEINNLIYKEKIKPKKRCKKYNSSHKINNKIKLLDSNAIINIKKKFNYNLFFNKNSRNKISNLYDKSSTLSLMKERKTLNSNSINNNNTSEINIIKSYMTISSKLKEKKIDNDKLKINLELTKIPKIKKQKRNKSNKSKKIITKKINLLTENKLQNKHLFNYRKKINKVTNIKKQNGLFPLSARMSGIINDDSNSLTHSLNNNSKSKNKIIKYPLNKINSLTTTHINDFKNKKSKNFNNFLYNTNNNLTLSLIKKEEERKLIKKMKSNVIPDISTGTDNRRKIISNKLSISNFNNSEMNSFQANTLNSTISKFNNSLTIKNSYKMNANLNLRKNNLLRSLYSKHNFKKENNNSNSNLGINIEKNNRKIKYYEKRTNPNEPLKLKKYKEKLLTNKNKENNKNINFFNSQFLADDNSCNDYSNYYSSNFNNNSNLAHQNKSNLIIESKNYKKIKNLRYNMNNNKDSQNEYFNHTILNRNNKNYFSSLISESNIKNRLLFPFKKFPEKTPTEYKK